MKTSIVKVSKPAMQVRNTQRNNKPANGLADYQANMQQLWLMYQEQLQRNFDLMQIINRQQLLHQQTPVIVQPAELLFAPAEPQVEKKPAKPESDIAPLNFKRLNTLAHNLQTLGIVTRIDAANSLVNFIYMLQCMGGSAVTETLFQNCAISSATGYRYTALLSKCRFIEYKGSDNFAIRVYLTKQGHKFLEGDETASAEAT